MEQDLRFIDRWPPVHVWERFPNWVVAYDEEGINEHAESMLKPADIQDAIPDGSGTWSAGEITQADGQRRPALLLFDDYDGPGQIAVFVAEELCWEMWFDRRQRKWRIRNEQWIPEEVRNVTPAFNDQSVFPMRICSWLPYQVSGTPCLFVINADATESEETPPATS